MKKDLKKIVMIGPVYPYKGGIAHYTGLMCKALRKKYDVTMVSFQMQYPKFLYKKNRRTMIIRSLRCRRQNTGYTLQIRLIS